MHLVTKNYVVIEICVRLSVPVGPLWWLVPFVLFVYSMCSPVSSTKNAFAYVCCWYCLLWECQWVLLPPSGKKVDVDLYRENIVLLAKKNVQPDEYITTSYEACMASLLHMGGCVESILTLKDFTLFGLLQQVSLRVEEGLCPYSLPFICDELAGLSVKHISTPNSVTGDSTHSCASRSVSISPSAPASSEFVT